MPLNLSTRQKVEADENDVAETDKVTIEQKRTRRTLVSMRLALMIAYGGRISFVGLDSFGWCYGLGRLKL